MKYVLLFSVLCLSGVFAQDNKVTIEPPAPASYTDESPAYLFFKKIVITRKSKSTYDFDITLQGDIPPKAGANYAVFFDFSGLAVTKPAATAENFASDMLINIFRGPLDGNFEVVVHGIEKGNVPLVLEVSPVRPRGDEISFTVKSPVFLKDMPTMVMFTSQRVGQSSKTYVVSGDGGGHSVKPTGLNPESNSAWAAATAGPAPSPLPNFKVPKPRK